MSKNQLEYEIATFDLNRYKQSMSPFENRRRDFVRRFSISRIRTMDIDEYVQGHGIKEDNFCYELEWQLGALGKISGASCQKFGIFYSRKRGRYEYTSYWDRGSKSKSFHALREELADFIEAGRVGDMESIRQSNFGPMFKGKILSTYFPNKFLSVFSEEHLMYYIHALRLDHKVKKGYDIFDLRQVLVDYKNRHPILKSWPLVLKSWPLAAFSHFLYNSSIKYPKNEKAKTELYIDAEFIDGDFDSLIDKPKSEGQSKGDYDAQNKTRQELGDRGEYVVMQKESALLKAVGVKKKPTQLSLTDDSLGYDILSFNPDGSPKYIEVKSTTSLPKDFRFFLTDNEHNTALELGDAYHVYIVFNPHNAYPKIWDLGNPFTENGKMKLMPVTYKLHLKKK